MGEPDRYELDLNNYNWLGDQVDYWESDQAKSLGEMLIEKLNPSSVIDLGCSSGIYLVPYLERGIEVHGVDGANGVGKHIPGNFEVFDLRQPYTPAHRYDLCYCIEVLEHLRPEFAEMAVASICRCADTMFISAAREGQSGESHLNCQNRPYWLDLFSRFGVGLHPKNDEVMAVINADPVYDRTHWLRWNGMLLRKI